MNTEVSSSCVWCSLPVTTRAFAVALLVSLILHLAVVCALVGASKYEAKPKVRVIDLGQIVIHLPAYQKLRAEASSVED